MMALKVTNWDAEAVERSGEGIAKCRKVRSQCYFNVIFSFSRSQMPHNKPSYSDLLDFFAYICAHFQRSGKIGRRLLRVSDLERFMKMVGREIQNGRNYSKIDSRTA